jgi:hypothetical protein
MFNRLRLLLALSFLVGLLNIVLPMANPVPGAVSHVTLIGFFGAPALWLALFTVALVNFGWRGLWLLLSAPLALVWLLFFALLLFGVLDIPIPERI